MAGSGYAAGGAEPSVMRSIVRICVQARHPLNDTEEGVISATFDLDIVRLNRASFGFFRDRRPDLYQVLLS